MLGSSRRGRGGSSTSRSAATAMPCGACWPRAASSAWLEPLALERFFTVPDPRRRVLDELPYQLYAARVRRGAAGG